MPTRRIHSSSAAPRPRDALVVDDWDLAPPEDRARRDILEIFEDR